MNAEVNEGEGERFQCFHTEINAQTHRLLHERTYVSNLWLWGKGAQYKDDSNSDNI